MWMMKNDDDKDAQSVTLHARPLPPPPPAWPHGAHVALMSALTVLAVLAGFKEMGCSSPSTFWGDVKPNLARPLPQHGWPGDSVDTAWCDLGRVF
jgi:hypothetical protein